VLISGGLDEYRFARAQYESVAFRASAAGL
jgi:hypothetical protein